MGKEITKKRNAAVILNVDGKNVLSTNVTYEDLKWLYKDYEKRNGKLPTTKNGLLKNNLPQCRIVNRVIAENNKTYNDFMLELGKVSHVRTESKDYDLFLNKYIKISTNIGHALNQKELVNNHYGLPSVKWFVEKCPDKTVKTFNDFVLWCGFDSNVLKKDKDIVVEKLIELEKSLGRAITGNDITLENVGFTPIVITRIWGNLNNCKKELGLIKTPPTQPKSFEYYNQILLEIINNISKDIDRKFITWNDIENEKYNKNSTEHKTFLKAFKREGIDFYAYLKQLGYQMNKGKFCNSYTFDDGERTVSTYEYDFSSFLRDEMNYKYNIDYKRNVLYGTFDNDLKRRKINCDYVININGQSLYIEVAGIIYNRKDNSWKEVQYSTKIENDYKDKMIFKEGSLLKCNKPFLFLFPFDMKSGNYKEMFKEFVAKHI